MLNTPYRWLWIKGDELEWKATFESKQYVYTVSLKHIVSETDQVDFWDGSFSVGDQENQRITTNEYDSYRVMSTIIDIYYAFCDYKQPQKLVFVGSRTNNRSRVYEKLIRNFIPSLYTLSVEQTRAFNRFVLYKSDTM